MTIWNQRAVRAGIALLSSLRWQIAKPKLNDMSTFLVPAHNLTDATERNAVALNKDLVVMRGRDIRFVVRETF